MRTRRTKEDIARIKYVLYEVLEADHPMTVRQVFYQLASNLCVIEKTEREYKGTVCRLLAEMRRAGEIPYGWIADSTRWVRRAETYGSMEEALRITAEAYRRSLWVDAPVRVEIWLEKDALAGVLWEEVERWGVPLYVTRGYPSMSYLHAAAETILRIDKPTRLYYFGDYDPSGVDISRAVHDGLREHLPDGVVTFERVAVEPWQIEAWDLPSRPTKKSDVRSKSFKGESVEVDTIPPRKLREIVRECIGIHVNQGQLERTRLIEQRERETLMQFANSLAA